MPSSLHPIFKNVCLLGSNRASSGDDITPDFNYSKNQFPEVTFADFSECFISDLKIWSVFQIRINYLNKKVG